MEYIKVTADTDPIRKAFAKANGIKPALLFREFRGCLPQAQRRGCGLRGAGRDEQVDSGHTVIRIDHNLAVLAHADYAIDLGLGAGLAGGQAVFSGTPADLAEQRDSVTGRFCRRPRLPLTFCLKR